VFGILLFGEEINLAKIAFLSLILIGVIGLKVVSPH
jgi:multidrug transporter EmrE-like cation transporter